MDVQMYSIRNTKLLVLSLEDHVVCIKLFSDKLLQVQKIYVRIMGVQMYSMSNTKLLVWKTVWFVLNYFPIYRRKYPINSLPLHEYL